MPYVEVDVDLDEFETSELVDEVLKRLKKVSGGKTVDEKKRIELKIAVQDLASFFGVPDEMNINSLDDKLKYEHLVSVFNKYTLAQIQERLPE